MVFEPRLGRLRLKAQPIEPERPVYKISLEFLIVSNLIFAVIS